MSRPRRDGPLSDAQRNDARASENLGDRAELRQKRGRKPRSEPGRLTKDQANTRPARGYSWAPFAEGNDAAVRHGGYSAERWRPIADELANRLAEVAPWSSAPPFTFTVAAWARAEAQAVLVADWLDEHGVLDEEGNPRPAVATFDRFDRSAQALRTELGISPVSLARLLRDVRAVEGAVEGTGLEALVEEGRKIRLAAEKRQAALGAARGDGGADESA